MENIWAPWRYKYILEAQTDGSEDSGCVFCKEDEFIVFIDELCTVRLNKFPYNNGHLLVIPRRHIALVEDLTDEEKLRLFDLIVVSKRILDKVLFPQGYNVGLNLGKCAGAGIEGHLHFHIVPRWNGDTNFMPVISDTKVISQSLNELKGILEKEFRLWQEG